MMQKRNVIVLSAVLFVSLSGYMFTRADTANPFLSSPKPVEKSKAFMPTIEEAKQINHRQFESVVPDTLPVSLTGTSHEASLRVDDRGDLIVDGEIQQLIEFYLSAVGEEPLDLLLARIQLELTQQLEQPALSQAMQLLKRYIDYKIALAETILEPVSELSGGEPHTNIQMRKQTIEATRRDYFTEVEYDQFFSDEARYDQFMLDHLAVTKDTSLSVEQRHLKLVAIEQQLPEHIQKTRQKVTQYANLYEDANSLRVSGASIEQIYALREQELGSDAALALAELDEQRLHWKQRLDNYVIQRNRLLVAGLSDEDKDRAVENLIENNFSGTEIIRVKALNSSL